jgi:hypothetical protein
MSRKQQDKNSLKKPQPRVSRNEAGDDSMPMGFNRSTCCVDGHRLDQYAS